MSQFFEVLADSGDTRIGDGAIAASAMFHLITGEAAKGAILPNVPDPTLITGAVDSLMVYHLEPGKLVMYNAGSTATGVYRQIGFQDKIITLSDASGTFVWNVFDGNNAIMTLTAATVLSPPTNFNDGDIAHLQIGQDAGGGNPVTLPAGWLLPGGAYAQSVGGGQIDCLTLLCTGENVIVTSQALNIS